MPRVPRKAWPRSLKGHHVVKGVFVGGCVGEEVTNPFWEAHAHHDGDFEHWLCFRTAALMKRRLLVIHELAHLTSGHGHDDVWRKEVLRLGGTIDAVPGLLRSYRKEKKPWL